MIDQVKVIEIGADAIEEVLQAAPAAGLAYPPKLMHAVVAALGRHGFIVEDRYEEEVEVKEEDFVQCSALSDEEPSEPPRKRKPFPSWLVAK